jgi:hypothetical protein
MTELPKPVLIGMEEVDFSTFAARYGYTADQMRDYGRAEYLRAINDICADWIQSYGFDMYGVAEHIRALKEKRHDSK